MAGRTLLNLSRTSPSFGRFLVSISHFAVLKNRPKDSIPGINFWMSASTTSGWSASDPSSKYHMLRRDWISVMTSCIVSEKRAGAPGSPCCRPVWDGMVSSPKNSRWCGVCRVEIRVSRWYICFHCLHELVTFDSIECVSYI